MFSAARQSVLSRHMAAARVRKWSTASSVPTIPTPSRRGLQRINPDVDTLSASNSFVHARSQLALTRNNTVGELVDVQAAERDTESPSMVKSAVKDDSGVDKRPLRQKIFLLLDDPSSSRAAFVVNAFFVTLILASTAAFLAESHPKLSGEPQFGNDTAVMWFWLEAGFILCFTFEYLLRWATSPQPLHFPIIPLNVIDLVAILPFYVELITRAASNGHITEGSSLQFLRIFRLARVLRVLKMGRKYSGTAIIVSVFRNSLVPLGVPFFFLTLAIIVLSTALFYVERGEYNPSTGRFYITNAHGIEQESLFTSIPDSLWWAIVTMTTVGYGDMAPVTSAGRLIGSLAIIIGILFVAMPLTIIGNEFTDAWERIRGFDALQESEDVEMHRNTNTWCEFDCDFFQLTFTEVLTAEEFLGLDEGLSIPRAPAALTVERLTTDMVMDAGALANLPRQHLRLATRLHHMLHAEMGSEDPNRKALTVDFVSELLRYLGFDLYTSIGVRSSPSLRLFFGRVVVESEPCLSAFTWWKKEGRYMYTVLVDCQSSDEEEATYKIAGDLLAASQTVYLESGSKVSRPVYLVSVRGRFFRFYTLYESFERLGTIVKGVQPDQSGEILAFPPRNMPYIMQTTRTGFLDFLIHQQRRWIIDILLCMKRTLTEIAEDVNNGPSPTNATSITSDTMRETSLPSPTHRAPSAADSDSNLPKSPRGSQNPNPLIPPNTFSMKKPRMHTSPARKSSSRRDSSASHTIATMIEDCLLENNRTLSTSTSLTASTIVKANIEDESELFSDDTYEESSIHGELLKTTSQSSWRKGHAEKWGRTPKMKLIRKEPEETDTVASRKRSMTCPPGSPPKKGSMES